MSDIPAFPSEQVKVRIVDPGTREVKVLRFEGQKRNGGHTDVVKLTPHRRGDTIIFAGYHATTETWIYTTD